MATSNNLILLGKLTNASTHRAMIAMKLKGLEYEYVKEDAAQVVPTLTSPENLEKAILLHDGRPVFGSVNILQYIDETWRENPIMPASPYERAVARYWCHFVDEKFKPLLAELTRSPDKDMPGAVSKVQEHLRQLEHELKDGFFKGRKFFGGDDIGIVDIVLGCGSHWLSLLEEVVDVKVMHPQVFPMLCAWTKNFEAHEAVKESIPDHATIKEDVRRTRAVCCERCDDACGCGDKDGPCDCGAKQGGGGCCGDEATKGGGCCEAYH